MRRIHYRKYFIFLVRLATGIVVWRHAHHCLTVCMVYSLKGECYRLSGPVNTQEKSIVSCMYRIMDKPFAIALSNGSIQSQRRDLRTFENGTAAGSWM